MNQCVLSGNLGADPEFFVSAEGTAVASFNLAFPAPKKKTGWLRVVAFHKLAETVERYLHKGAKVAVVGSLDQHKWTTEEGATKNSFRLICQAIDFIKTDGRGFEGAPEDDLPF